MTVRSDKVPNGATSDRRTIQALLGILTVLDIDLGWSSSCVGRLFGRLKLPLAVPGYLWLDIKLFGRSVVAGSLQLS
jgi:hypothetical protein